MHCTVHELQRKLEAGEDFLLLDVRTEEELEIARIEGCHHIPLHELEERIGELASWKDREVVCMCHHGGRSAMAQGFLCAQGFQKVLNLTGGIHAWACEIDPDMEVYD